MDNIKIPHPKSTYVLITPARNEEDHIGQTIQSVVAQSILPLKWIIVSDASTDKTDEIALAYARRFDFIELIRADGDKKRNFGSKAKIIKIGYEHLKAYDFDYIGNLDADVTFDENYFENILGKFHVNAKLGIAGGVICDVIKGEINHPTISANWSVCGAIQLFRRKCYEDIGGYIPIKRGIDAIAEVMARMQGWEVRSFPEFKVLHHRSTGTAEQSALSARLKLGNQDYTLGYTPLFEMSRCLYRTVEKPYIIGAMLILVGYLNAWLRKEDLLVPMDVKNYLKIEQTQRLKHLFRIPFLRP